MASRGAHLEREGERDEEEAWATEGPLEGIRIGWLRKIQSKTE